MFQVFIIVYYRALLICYYMLFVLLVLFLYCDFNRCGGKVISFPFIDSVIEVCLVLNDVCLLFIECVRFLLVNAVCVCQISWRYLELVRLFNFNA